MERIIYLITQNKSMSKKKRVFAYYDGSNFYHCVKDNYGITNINFFDMANQLLELSKEGFYSI